MRNERTHNDRREDIIRAALATFGEKGIINTKIEEVAAEAGIGKGTVYEYFRSKEEMISAAIRYEMEDLAVQVKSRMDSGQTVKAKLDAIIETILLHHQQYRRSQVDIGSAITAGGGFEELKALYTEQNGLWLTWLEEIVADGVETGEIRQVDPQLLLGALTGAVMNLLQPWGTPDWEGTYSPAEAASQITELFFEGIKKA